MATTNLVAAENTAVKAKAKEYIVRFSLRQRIEHIVLMTTFTLLSITGLLQLFPTNRVVSSIILGLGGIGTLRIIHRTIGVIFTLSMVYHAIYLVWAVVIKRQRPTIMPTMQDFRDVIAEMKVSLGLKAQPPKFRRFDYRQKFEYVGVLFGSVIIIVTGLMLMFPDAITNVISGQFIAMAARFHGYEATLAVMTIVVWHFYSVMLSPRVFPADTSIFTGKISRERMEEEHPAELAEIDAAKE